MLGHLLPVLVLDQSHDDDIAVGRGVEQDRSQGHQGVEPAARLVERFGDEIRREVTLEQILVFKGVVPLGKRHRSGVKPAVDHLADPGHLAAAFFAAQVDLVDVGLMQLDVVRAVVRQALQLGDASDQVAVAAAAGPDRQRSAPVALAGDAPVDHVLEEVAEPTIADGFRNPVDGGVVLKQVVAYGGHAHKPGIARVVDQGGVAAPAERVGMLVRHRLDQKAFPAQPPDQALVRFFAELAGKIADLRRHGAVFADQLDKRQVIAAADTGVVFAKRRRDVHDAGAVGQGHVTVCRDIKGLFAAVGDSLARIREQRFVSGALQVAAPHAPDDPVGSAQNLLDQTAGHVVADLARAAVQILVEFSQHVLLVGIDAQRDIGRQGPGGRRPGGQVGVRLAGDAETDENRRVDHILVALGDFMAGQGGPAARAVRDDLVPFVEQSLVPDLAQRPPFRLDVVVLVGDVRVFHVGPETDPV